MKHREQKRWLIDLTAPVNEEGFLEMLQVFHQACLDKGTVPGSFGLSEIIAIESDGKAPCQPIMIGMRAVSDALTEKGIRYKQGYLARIGSISQITSDETRFLKFMDEIDHEIGGRPIAEALLRSAAISKFRISRHGIGFDLDDVLKNTEQFAEEL